LSVFEPGVLPFSRKDARWGKGGEEGSAFENQFRETPDMTNPTQRATGWIHVTRYDPKPYDESAGGTLFAVEITEDFSGGLTGTGAARFLMAQMPDASAYFTGIERFTGTLAGRAGSFLLRNTGVLKENAVTSEWLILPGSATGELTGLSGSGGVDPSGYFLNFALE
jgi:hypothetical protein